MLIRSGRGIPASEITPKSVYANRREFLAAAGITALGLAFPPKAAHAANRYPDLVKSPFSTTEKPTPYQDVTHYNNFYEFGTSKEEPATRARNLKTSPWTVSVEGEVGKPKRYGLDELLKLAPLEERIYRHRCVEAWSIVVPWIGFPLNALIKQVEPTSKARFVAFESFYDPRQMLSSLAAGGPASPGRPRREEDAPHPVSLYGESKLAGERAVRDLAGRLGASIVRPPIVYGPGDREFVPMLARMARLGLVLTAGRDERRYSVLHVEDLCQGLLAVAERGSRVEPGGSAGIYYLDDGAEHRWEDIGRAACAALGRRAVELRLPMFFTVLAAARSAVAASLSRKPAMLSFDKLKEVRQATWTCSSERARREIGYEPRVPLETGMRQALSWFCSPAH